MHLRIIAQIPFTPVRKYGLKYIPASHWLGLGLGLGVLQTRCVGSVALAETHFKTLMVCLRVGDVETHFQTSTRASRATGSLFRCAVRIENSQTLLKAKHTYQDQVQANAKQNIFKPYFRTGVNGIWEIIRRCIEYDWSHTCTRAFFRFDLDLTFPKETERFLFKPVTQMEMI